MLQYSLPPTTSVELDFLQQCRHRQNSGEQFTPLISMLRTYVAMTAVDDLCDFGGKAKAKCRKRSRSTVSRSFNADRETGHHSQRNKDWHNFGRRKVDNRYLGGHF